MSPIALGMNLMLAVLLLSALGFGWRLDRRLKALRDGQAHFAGAVADLDRAARRAEAGLADLRVATEEAVDLLAGRIEKARELAARLETLTADAARPVERRIAERPLAERRPPERASSRPPVRGDLPLDRAEAAAEELVLNLTERQVPPPERPLRPEPRPTPRSRASVDDDLFELHAAYAPGRPSMNRIPRILPLVAVAIGGVIAINALEGGPGLVGAMKSFAEDVAPRSAKPAMSPVANLASAAPAKPAAPVCAPTAAELAKEAGLSPAELQVLQSLGTRRGQLDQRESDLDTQVQLIAAAEAKLDARIAQMNGLKTDIQGLLNQADQQQQSETDRLVRVYEAMKPKDAAGRMTLMDNSVRLPMAAKMKERALAAILSQMPPEDAKALTEKLANRVSGAQSLTDARNALNPPVQPAATQAAAAAPAAAPAAKPGRKARRPAAAQAAPAASPAASPAKSG